MYRRAFFLPLIALLAVGSARAELYARAFTGYVDSVYDPAGMLAISVGDPVLAIAGLDNSLIYGASVVTSPEGTAAIYRAVGLMQVLVSGATFTAFGLADFLVDHGECPVPGSSVPPCDPDLFTGSFPANRESWPIGGGEPEWLYGLGLEATASRPGYLLKSHVLTATIFYDMANIAGGAGVYFRGYLAAVAGDGVTPQYTASFVLLDRFIPGLDSLQFARTAGIAHVSETPEPAGVFAMMVVLPILHWAYRRKIS